MASQSQYSNVARKRRGQQGRPTYARLTKPRPFKAHYEASLSLNARREWFDDEGNEVRLPTFNQIVNGLVEAKADFLGPTFQGGVRIIHKHKVIMIDFESIPLAKHHRKMQVAINGQNLILGIDSFDAQDEDR